MSECISQHFVLVSVPSFVTPPHLNTVILNVYIFLITSTLRLKPCGKELVQAYTVSIMITEEKIRKQESTLLSNKIRHINSKHVTESSSSVLLNDAINCQDYTVPTVDK